MNNIKKAYLELHVAVLLFGFTAILGDLIQLSAVMIVWWRVLITCISLLYFIQFGIKLRSIPRDKIFKFLGIGVLVALHWITFYGAIKLSNASVALICFASTSLFTSFLEPAILGRPIEKLQVMMGLMIIPGMCLIVNTVNPAMLNGIYIGLLSALLAAIFSTLNKRLIDDADSYSITFLELGSAWIFISLLVPVLIWNGKEIQFWPVGTDWTYLLILALLCTTLAYILSLRALKYVSAFVANLTINLEPVYGILLAVILLNDHKELSPRFYVGVVLISAIVFSYPLIKKRMKKSIK